MYAVLIVFFLRAIIQNFRYKQVLYNRSVLVINTYFSRESIEVQISDVISIKKIFSLYPQYFRMIYKITFMYENGLRDVLFYKSLSLYQTDDIEGLLGIKQSNENNY